MVRKEGRTYYLEEKDGKLCKRCGKPIVDRHYFAEICSGCLYSRSRGEQSEEPRIWNVPDFVRRDLSGISKKPMKAKKCFKCRFADVALVERTSEEAREHRPRKIRIICYITGDELIVEGCVF